MGQSATKFSLLDAFIPFYSLLRRSIKFGDARYSEIVRLYTIYGIYFHLLIRLMAECFYRLSHSPGPNHKMRNIMPPSCDRVLCLITYL